jgi:hypothetical protein
MFEPEPINPQPPSPTPVILMAARRLLEEPEWVLRNSGFDVLVREVLGDEEVTQHYAQMAKHCLTTSTREDSVS